MDEILNDELYYAIRYIWSKYEKTHWQSIWISNNYENTKKTKKKRSYGGLSRDTVIVRRRYSSVNCRNSSDIFINFRDRPCRPINFLQILTRSIDWRNENSVQYFACFFPLRLLPRSCLRGINSNKITSENGGIWQVFIASFDRSDRNEERTFR